MDPKQRFFANLAKSISVTGRGGKNSAATGNPELEATGSLLLADGPHGSPVNNYILEQNLGKSRQVGGDAWAATAKPEIPAMGSWARQV